MSCIVAGSHPCLGQVTLSPDEAVSLAAAKALLKENFVRHLVDSELDIKSIGDLMRAVDPDFGDYLSPEDVAAIRQGLPSAAGAFGLTLLRRDHKIVAVPRRNGPAAIAGLQFGDHLIEVEGQRVEGWTPWRLDRLFPNEPAAGVSIVVDRAGVRLRFKFEGASRDFEEDEPSARRPIPDVLLIRVPKLSGMTTLGKTANILRAEWNKSPPRGLILDLRGNSGGLLQSAVGHASIFVAEDSAVARLRSNSALANGARFKARPEYYTRRGESDPLAGLPAEVKALPLAVLVDEGTASGAELIAAAVRDNGRGIVIGGPTFGVAAIQLESRLPNGGAIRYTTAYWEPASGVAVQGAGVSDRPKLLTEALEALQMLEASEKDRSSR